jgi:hypothetical protein
MMKTLFVVIVAAVAMLAVFGPSDSHAQISLCQNGTDCCTKVQECVDYFRGEPSTDVSDCEYPLCPHGFNLNPSNDSVCLASEGVDFPEGSVFFVYTDINDCLTRSPVTDSNTSPTFYSYQTRTCLEPFNTAFKSCLKYRGLLG